MVRSSKPRRGFTLVELLVVIGIIAVLIGILLPVIGKARRQANTTPCMASLRSLGQTLAIYTSENRGSYPYSYYTSNSPVGGVTAEGDSNSSVYVWWSVLRSYMRRGGSPDNSIVDASGNEIASRFMKAFSCPEGHDPEAGCDFGTNMVIFPEMNNETYPASQSVNTKAPFGCKPLKVTQTYPDNILIFDQTEIAVGIDPPYSRQYVCGYGIDLASFQNPKQAFKRYRQMAADAAFVTPGSKLANDVPIDPGPNRDTKAPGAVTDPTVGNIRWRHGANDSANFLFADGTVRTMKITKGTPGSPNCTGDVLHSHFRPKAPQGFKPVG